MIYLSTLDIPSTHIWDGNISSIGTADTYMGWRRIGHPGDKSVRHETCLKSIPRPNLGQPNPYNSRHPCKQPIHTSRVHPCYGFILLPISDEGFTYTKIRKIINPPAFEPGILNGT